MRKNKNTFIDLVNKRQSTRNFSNKAVDLDAVKRCIEAARMAPSACNSQPWTFHVVREPGMRQVIAESTLQKGLSLNQFALNAPVLVVVSVTKGNLKTKVGQMINGLPYYLIDVGIAAEHFCLQATEEDLGTCMIGWFKEKVISDQLKLSKNERVALVIALGHPENDIERNKVRKSLDEITVVYE